MKISGVKVTRDRLTKNRAALAPLRESRRLVEMSHLIVLKGKVEQNRLGNEVLRQ